MDIQRIDIRVLAVCLRGACLLGVLFVLAVSVQAEEPAKAAGQVPEVADAGEKVVSPQGDGWRYIRQVLGGSLLGSLVASLYQIHTYTGEHSRKFYFSIALGFAISLGTSGCLSGAAVEMLPAVGVRQSPAFALATGFFAGVSGYWFIPAFEKLRNRWLEGKLKE